MDIHCDSWNDISSLIQNQNVSSEILVYSEGIWKEMAIFGTIWIYAGLQKLIKLFNYLA